MAQDSWTLEQEDSALPPSPPHAPSPCSNNCGFFGSSSTMNLCSSCFSKASAAAAAAASSSSSVDLSSLTRPASPYFASSPSPALLLPAAASPPASHPSHPLQKQPPSRCFACRKRVGLTGFKCRCGDVFCSLHRYSDKHNCSFDYKAAARAAISKANPVVKAEKIEKI